MKFKPSPSLQQDPIKLVNDATDSVSLLFQKPADDAPQTLIAIAPGQTGHQDVVVHPVEEFAPRGTLILVSAIGQAQVKDIIRPLEVPKDDHGKRSAAQ